MNNVELISFHGLRELPKENEPIKYQIRFSFRLSDEFADAVRKIEEILGKRGFYRVKDAVNVYPLERPMTMTYSDLTIADKAYEDRKKVIEFEDNTADSRYDTMMQDFYAYVMGTKENPFTYEHDYKVQKVLSEICELE